jgi:glycosyltransferase involved in cell wall biosynthesis
MKVLFVASGNKKGGRVSAFVQSQFDSLQKEGLDMMMYPVVGHGWRGYLRNFRKLRRLILKEKPDVVHAHYSSCGYLAALAAMGQPLKKVVSILGSFPTESRKLRFVRFCIDHVWHTTIVKSERTRAQLDRALPVIPNGVDLSLFPLTGQDEAKERVGFGKDGKYVIFVSNPARPEKNYRLAQAAVQTLQQPNLHLVPVFDKPHSQVVDYMCAADVLIMTSLNEGSPNVIKEAMACNCPIVVTDVGDVRWVTSGVDGTFVADTFKAEELADLLKKALAFNGRTRGRERITELELTTQEVSSKLISIYNTVLKCR